MGGAGADGEKNSRPQGRLFVWRRRLDSHQQSSTLPRHARHRAASPWADGPARWVPQQGGVLVSLSTRPSATLIIRHNVVLTISTLELSAGSTCAACLTH